VPDARRQDYRCDFPDRLKLRRDQAGRRRLSSANACQTSGVWQPPLSLASSAGNRNDRSPHRVVAWTLLH
jgi:hypothetical protein